MIQTGQESSATLSLKDIKLTNSAYRVPRTNPIKNVSQRFVAADMWRIPIVAGENQIKND